MQMVYDFRLEFPDPPLLEDGFGLGLGGERVFHTFLEEFFFCSTKILFLLNQLEKKYTFNTIFNIVFVFSKAVPK